MKAPYLLHTIGAVLILAQVGCGPTDITITKKPSYADLIVVYNAEVETLEKLEADRRALIAEHFGQAQLMAMREAASSIASEDAQNVPSNPNEALDKAVAAAELQAQLQSGLVQSLGLSSETEKDTKDLPEELQLKLAELDAEIATQRQRVQRAKEERDAAQAR